LSEIIDFIQHAIKTQFTGYLQINFFKGGIAKINKFQTLELKDLK